MLIQELIEARKFSELNPKISINQHIKNQLEQADYISDTNVKNSFVSFTTLDKLGINPQSIYSTPLGIYSYTSEYVYKIIQDHGSPKELFAGDSLYANLFSVKGNILVLNDMTNDEVEEYYDRIIQIYLEYAYGKKEYDLSMSYNLWQPVREIIELAPRQAKVQSPGGHFWYVTMTVADEMTPTTDFDNIKGTKLKKSIGWNTLFRRLGIDGCVDLGEGIIHINEPEQAVFFHYGAIDSVTRVRNSYSPEEVEDQVRHGEKRKQTNTNKQLDLLTADEIVRGISRGKLKESDIQFVKNPQTRLDILRSLPELIIYLPRASAEEQYTAIRSSLLSVGRIRQILGNVDVKRSVLIPLIKKYPIVGDAVVQHQGLYPQFLTYEMAKILILQDPVNFLRFQRPTYAMADLAAQQGLDPQKIKNHMKLARSL